MSIDKKIKYDMQGGVKNYLGKQKQVKAPLKWQSGPDHPSTELAYITEAEKNLLIKQDLHNSLKGGANRGPSGIMSLNGWGDADDGFGSDGVDSGSSNDQDNSGYDGGGGGGDSSYAANETYTPTEVETPAIGPASYAGLETVKTRVNPKTPKDTYDQKYTGGGFFSGANKYGYTDTIGGLGDNRNDTKPGYGGRIMGGLLGLATGIPFIGGAIGNAYDKGKGLFTKQPQDMSKFNNLGYGGTNPAYGFGVPTQQGDYDLLGNKINELTGEIISPTGDSFGFIPGYPEGPDSNVASPRTIPMADNNKSDQYVNLVEKYVPDDPVIPSSAFKSRFLGNRSTKEREAIEKMINEKFKYDYNSFGLGDMDGS